MSLVEEQVMMGLRLCNCFGQLLGSYAIFMCWLECCGDNSNCKSQVENVNGATRGK